MITAIALIAHFQSGDQKRMTHLYLCHGISPMAFQALCDSWWCRFMNRQYQISELVFVEMISQFLFRYFSDQIRAIYDAYPRVTNSQDGNEASPSGVEFSEAAVAARTRVEGCTSFLRAALK